MTLYQPQVPGDLKTSLPNSDMRRFTHVLGLKATLLLQSCLIASGWLFGYQPGHLTWEIHEFITLLLKIIPFTMGIFHVEVRIFLCLGAQTKWPICLIAHVFFKSSY